MPAPPPRARFRGRALAAALILGGGCVAPPAAPPPARPPLVLLVSLDTFRADLLDERQADGSPRTPRLLELAGEAIRFDAAFAPIAFTLPSHLTLFTGLHPEIHGVGADGQSRAAQGQSLGPGIPTLAGLLREAGYRTAAVVNCNWMSAEFGFDRGFETYERLPGLAGSARAVTDRALAELPGVSDRAPDERPLFLFVHYFEAHSDFPSQGTRLTYYSPPGLRADLPVPDDSICDAAGRCATEVLAAADADGRELPAGEIALHHELYRRGATYLDAELGRLLDAVRARGSWDRALVVVTADHGEEFREHGRFLHTQAHRESLRVPLLVKLPGGRRAGERDGRLAELADLLPTFAAMLSLPRPAGAEGLDLLDPERPGHDAIVGRDRTGGTLYALRSRERLLLHDPAAGASRLFRLDLDPGETIDRAAELPAETELLVARLEEKLRRLRSLSTAPPGERGPRFDDEERERLRSLGYL